MVASALDTDNETALGLINRLLGQKLIFEWDGPNPRYIVDYKVMLVTEAEREVLVQRRTPFVDQGAPNSDQAMRGLERFFRDNQGPIYVAIEITDPGIFSKLLEERCRKNSATTFFVPQKQLLDPKRRRHYEDFLGRWIQTLKDGPLAPVSRYESSKSWTRFSCPQSLMHRLSRRDHDSHPWVVSSICGSYPKSDT
jgi:hypothetical protein